jgi:glycosyltransferase involved in cell wall biosynthesis
MPIPVSVILPVYKGEAYIKPAIESILQQSFKDFELIIVNDASPDNSEAIIQQFNDPRIKYFRCETNLGLVGALNKLIKLSSGKYLARMDQDDIAQKDRLQQQFNFLESNPDHVVCGTQVRVLGTHQLKAYPKTDEEVKVFMLFGSPFAHPAVMIRKSVLTDHQLQYDEQFKHAEDYGLWVQLSRYGKMSNIDYVGIDYRIHDSQYTKVFSDGMRISDHLIKNIYLSMLSVDIPQTDMVLYEKIARKEVNIKSEDEMKQIGLFLERFVHYFEHSSISITALKKYVYGRWKRLCIDRKKAGLRSYRIFFSSPVARWETDLKLHLWLLKPGS